PRIAYMTYSTRGCPYRCTYCCDSSLADMYADWRLLRRRSPENLIAEINHARRLLPGLQAVVFMDSTFLAVRLAEIRRFSDLYRAQVGLPFFVMGTPGSISEEKISCLVEAGLRELEMGIQSGSAAVRRQFHRFETNDTILKAARILRRYQPPLSRPTYDLISDNPYETAADKLETLRLLYRLPRPYALNMFSLNFFPGTEMHRRAQADGLLPDETAVYRKNLVQLQPTYYNFALWAFHRGLPRPLLWLLLQPRLLQWGETVLQRPFRLLFQLITRQRARHTRRNSRAQLARLAAQPAHSPPEHETAPTGAAA
ncbi:MAG: radical SAM protein, partial [Anaerolineales bacterium]|nr:radical SAM protein [Anaerolineales bacterium]